MGNVRHSEPILEKIETLHSILCFMKSLKIQFSRIANEFFESRDDRNLKC